MVLRHIYNHLEDISSIPRYTILRCSIAKDIGVEMVCKLLQLKVFKGYYG